ncbi:MAG TPA: type II secretion system protein [Terriglobia bacterium]|nr:type II secretion system protein [Terriglobia bacterium]
MLDLRMRRQKNFTLVELLLVLAIIGIISGIAIPAFMGQRKRARVIGDAKANAAALAMQMESRKAETGIYAASGTAVTWTKGVPSDATFMPNFTLKNATQMNYSLITTNGGVGYKITVTDPYQGSAQVLTVDQTGAVVLNATYNR